MQVRDSELHCDAGINEHQVSFATDLVANWKNRKDTRQNDLADANAEAVIAAANAEFAVEGNGRIPTRATGRTFAKSKCKGSTLLDEPQTRQLQRSVTGILMRKVVTVS